MNKTLWQKIYSLFGFQTRTCIVEQNATRNFIEYRVIYWICLPWFIYWRKFDIFWYEIDRFNFYKEMKKYN